MWTFSASRLKTLCSRHSSAVVVFLAFVVGSAAIPEPAAAAKSLTLARGGASQYVIVIARDALPPTRFAAEELQRFLGEITGAVFPMRADTEQMGSHEILVGDSAHLRQLGVTIDFPALGPEGYVLRTVGRHLVIAGGAPRGTLYGVYGLLEDHLGCRWFTPAVSRIPKRQTLSLPALNERRIPGLEYREPFTADCFDGTWCARNRVNSSAASLEARHGGKVRFGAGLFVHTFNVLIPPEKYFDQHPEYFSEVNGARQCDQTQLCCTHEDIVRLCAEALRERMRADPEAAVFSLSQNDWSNYCTCARCAALAEREGSQMAPVLQLVNRVAETLEAEFPDKAIETLAYQWTRKAPKTLRPRRNVIVRLCSIECCFMHPLATCDSKANADFRRDAADWARVADRLWVWDYVTSFSHYLVPFPNLRVRNDNIQFFVANNVRGIFEQDVYNTQHGELSALSGYLNAKLLWNPAYDEDLAINEFLEGVYGPAAKPIRRYIDLLHDKVADENIHADIWVGPVEAPYLSDGLLAEADMWWDQAERLAAKDPATLARVQAARLSPDYAWLERHKGFPYRLRQDAFSVEVDPEFTRRAERFLSVARRAGLTRLDEGRTSLDAYEAELRETLGRSGKTFATLAPVAAEQLDPGLEYAYYEGVWTNLPSFTALAPMRTGATERFDLSMPHRSESFGLRLRGYVRIPKDGLYCFFLGSNDGSRLKLGDTVLIHNDGLHKFVEKVGLVAVKAGAYPIQVEYFQAGGNAELRVGVLGPGLPKRELPAVWLFHQPRS
jgi:hypothetical protein